MSVDVATFLDGYQQTFQGFDADAIADLFHFPCQVTGDGEPATVASVPSREVWLGVLDRVLGGYRAVGVHTAERIETRVAQLSDHVAQATVRWRLMDERHHLIYEFDASYTLADLGRGTRITAIAQGRKPGSRVILKETFILNPAAQNQ